MHAAEPTPDEAATADELLERFLAESTGASRRIIELRGQRGGWDDDDQSMTASVERIRTVMSAHASLAVDLERWLQDVLSGSNRAWAVLSSIHQANDIQPVDVPYTETENGGVGFNSVTINSAKEDIERLRRELDARRVLTRGPRNRLERALRVYEGCRLHCVTKAHDLARQGESEGARRDESELEHNARYRAELGRIGNDVAQEVSRIQDSFVELMAGIGPGAKVHWELRDFDDWTPPAEVVPQLIGLVRYENSILNEQSPTPLEVPYLRDLRSAGTVVLPYSRAETSNELLEAVVRNFLARTLCSFPAGSLRVGVIDPMGMGNAVSRFLGLGEYNSELVSDKVRSETEGIKDLLSSLTTHIELVVQKYLRGTYSSLTEYNEAAGEVAEAYRVLIVQDFPHRFDDDMLHQLQRIIEHGPKCGVFTFITADTDVDENDFRRIDLDRLPLDSALLLDADLAPSANAPETDSAFLWGFGSDPASTLGEGPGGTIVDRIVRAVGGRSRSLEIDTALSKTFGKFAEVVAAGTRTELDSGLTVPALDEPSSWWANTAGDSVVAPIGRSGATDIAFLRLDSGNLTGALIVGRPGSGKSTLIHTILAGLTTLYGPDELELYLLDFKEGVEFADYADKGLPHAACIAVESERELGMNVLDSIVTELKRRAAEFKAAHVADIGGYRRSGRDLTRIVVFFDEFQVLFNDDDRIGQEAAKALDLIIKQGRSHGIHIVLSSQTLSGMIAINKQSLQLLNVRVLLPSSTEDAMTVMDDHNPAHKLISSRGEGILNNASGRESANIPFNGAFEGEPERKERLEALRAKADDSGFLRTPRIFESGTLARLEEEPRGVFALNERKDRGATGQPLSLRPGTAFSLNSELTVELRREVGANVLHVDRNTSEQLVGTLSGLWLSARSSNPFATHEIVAFSHITQELRDVISGLEAEGTATFSTARTAGERLGAVLAELDRRQDEQDFTSAPLILSLLGVQKARDLDPNSYSGSMSFDDEPTTSLHEQLEKIAAEGPEVGIHVIVAADSYQAVESRMSRKLQHEFSTRLIGAMSAEDIAQLTSSSVRVRPDQGQMIHYDIDTGTHAKYLPYVLSDPEWIRTVLPTGAVK
ncbi:FtsK/SpoIIIE domain-containing protein [Brevibacterium metallidurans]|uniref:FtsK domain-containing protein n=1 Tax=Brevibacterium metallidurans TaxID=1482676 RepID=A0ABN0SIT0_9MICO